MIEDEKMPIFTLCGVSAAVVATSELVTALACAVTVFVAVTVASAAAALSSRLTGRLGVITVYLAVLSGVMASASALFSNVNAVSADMLARALLLASVSTATLSCVPKSEETVPYSILRAAVTALVYAMLVSLFAVVRYALGLCVPFAASAPCALMMLGFIIAAVNFVLGLIAESKAVKTDQTEVTDCER